MRTALCASDPFRAGSFDRRQRVVVVDDVKLIRAVLCLLLTRRGYDVVGVAWSMASAMDAVERLVPDGILLDVHLPDGDGFDLTARLTAADPGLSVVLTSAAVEDSFHRRARAAGAQGFVPKSELARTDLSVYW